MKIYFLPFVLLLICSCGTSDDSAIDRTLESRIARIENGLTPSLQIKGQSPVTFNINERLDELNIPGLSVAFVANGEIEWKKAYGMADFASNRPMRTDTMLLAGSISKPVAALRAHQLVEEGVFDLDENINAYLSIWQLPDNEFTVSEKVTLRRILNHTAGLTVWGFPGYDNGDDIPSVVDVLDGLGNTDPVRVFKQPGESWLYSGGGYTIMQLAITETEGVTFPETMQRNVLDRINMQDSTYENPLPIKYHARAATGYRSNGDEVEGKWPIYPEMAAAGIILMLGSDGFDSDMLRQAQLVSGLYKDVRQDVTVFPAEEILAMLTLNGAAGLGMSDEIGSLEAGKKADFVCHDTDRPEWQPLQGIVNQLAWLADGRSVHSVWVDGVRVVDSYRSTLIDEESLYERARQSSLAIFERTGLPFVSPWPVA